MGRGLSLDDEEVDAMRADRTADAIEALVEQMAKQKPAPAPVVNVTVPKQDAPVVNVPAAKAPLVTVNVPDIILPAQPAPIVNLPPFPAMPGPLPHCAYELTITKRDAQGRIARARLDPILIP